MIDIGEFATDDMRSVVDKIMKIMQEKSEPEEIQTISSKPEPSKIKLKQQISANETTASFMSPKFETIYARMQNFQKKHDQELLKMKEQSEERHRMIHTHTPILSDKTRELIGNISPIHNRYKKEAENKDKRLKELTTKILTEKEQEIQKELTFTPKTTRSSSSIRTAEEYYNYMKSWKESREKIDQREREIKKDKVLEGVTFKPALNKNSAVLAKNFPSFETRLEKGIINREAKINEKKSVSPCSFKPELRTKYKKLELGPVFDRLYPNHIKQLTISPIKYS